DTERAVLLSLEAAKVEEADRDIRRLIDNLLRDILSRPYFNSILEGHRYFVYQAVFSPTRPWLASVDDGGELLLWDFSRPAPLPRPLNRPESGVYYWNTTFDYAPDSDHLVALGTKSTDELGHLHDNDPLTFIDVWNLQNQAAGPQRLPLPAVYDGLDLSQDQAAFDFITNPAIVQFALNGDQLLWLSPDQTVYRYDLTQPDLLPERLVQDSSPVVTLSPSGRYLATGDRFGLVRLRDLNFPTAPTFWFGQSSQGAEVTAVAFDITEQFLATANTNNVVRLWDATNDEPDSIRFPATDSVINALAVSPGGDYIVSNSTELSDLTVRVWDTQQPNNQPVVLEGHNSSLNSLGFNADGTILASTSDDKTVRLWNFSEAKAAPVILNEGLLPSLVQFSQDGELLTAVDRDGILYFWALNDLDTPATSLPLPLTWPTDAPIYTTGYAAPRVPIAIAPDARTIATAEGDDVKIWRVNPILTTVNEIYNLPRQTVPISALAFSEKQDALAVADTDGGLRLYQLNNLGPVPQVSEMTFLAGDVALERLAFSPDGRWLAGSLPQANEYAVRVWDLTAPTAAPVTLFGPTDFVADLAFAHGSDQLAAASYDTSVYLWQIAGDAVLPQPRILEGHEDYVFAVAFAPNDQTLASSSWDT
ncbi:MAG: WD40 repeat domain-containing protein, partial [Anaerolineales bacterium]|nr:WD40 repeat domain-containing protein [Anaerolineales bacterium]